jgi:hypothetical protein
MNTCVADCLSATHPFVIYKQLYAPYIPPTLRGLAGFAVYETAHQGSYSGYFGHSSLLGVLERSGSGIFPDMHVFTGKSDIFTGKVLFRLCGRRVFSMTCGRFP